MELQGVFHLVRVEGLGYNLVHVAFELHAAAHGDLVCPPHAHLRHRVGIQRTCIHRLYAFRPRHVCVKKVTVLPLDPVTVYSELAPLCRLAVLHLDHESQNSTRICHNYALYITAEICLRVYHKKKTAKCS